MRRDRRARSGRTAGAAHPDGQRRAIDDVLPVRRDGAVAGVAGDGRPGRGAGGHLPLAHRDRGLPVAHRHLLRRRAGRALRAGLHPRAGRRRGPVVPHRGRRGNRGAGPGRRWRARRRGRPDDSRSRRTCLGRREQPSTTSVPAVDTPPTARCPSCPRRIIKEYAHHGYRCSHPHHPAHLHRRREGRRGLRRHARRPAGRPRRPAPGPARPADQGRCAAPVRQRLHQRRGRALPRLAGREARRRRQRDDPARRRRWRVRVRGAARRPRRPRRAQRG